MKYKSITSILLFALLHTAAARADDFLMDYACLSQCYPGIVQGVSADSQGRRWIVVKGRGILYDQREPNSQEGNTVPQDAALKNAATQNVGPKEAARKEATPQGDGLDQADIKTSMAQPYPLEPNRPAPPPNFHPGRARSYDFLHAVYGQNRKEIEASMLSMPLGGSKKIKVANAAGLPEALAAVNAELTALLAARPDIKRYALPVDGGYFYRKISGEQRLSPHAFGIAIDLNPKMGPYWQWSGGAHHKAQTEYPTELVSIFEKHGFIWGGKWREYDLMHFEYRPELICKAKKLAAKTQQQNNATGQQKPAEMPSN